VTGTGLSSFISAAESCAHEMLSTASYIEGELPSLRLPPPYVKSIAEVCSSLVGTKHDVISELHELGELSADRASETVQDRVERIHAWLGEELPKLHKLVKSLESASQSQPEIGTAYILVAESAVNILMSFGKVTDAAKACFRAARPNAGA
jgi:hypothetical protein